MDHETGDTPIIGTASAPLEETFLGRMKIEHAHLTGKIDALTLFLNRRAPGVSDVQRALLKTQACIMRAYRHILEMRLADLGSSPITTDFKTTRVASEKEVGIGEPVEVGGHDESRDGPVPFDG